MKSLCILKDFPIFFAFLSRNSNKKCNFARKITKESYEMTDSPFTVVTPDSKNPYKQLYVAN